jgi:crotonobetainyl-CoA:carnitine CoA-transferase CaiB-like acyl-CoA transferase
LLADLGADVVKVERPQGGDDTRAWGPPNLKDADGKPTSESAYYLCTNRNKRSITIDIAQPSGQALIRRLAARADVVIENFKCGGLAKYGLDYPALAVSNPRLVYCSITGFGQTGPYAARAGYDLLIQGMGGLMSITGRADTDEGGGPQKVGVALTDIMTGLYATIAVQLRSPSASAPVAASTSTLPCSTCRSPASPTRRRTSWPAVWFRAAWATRTRTSCRIRTSRPPTAT